MVGIQNDGRIDSRPCRYVDGGNVVSKASVATLNTSKVVPRRPIDLLVVPARRADVRGSPRVYDMHRNSHNSGLILDERPKLIESPRTMFATLAFRTVVWLRMYLRFSRAMSLPVSLALATSFLEMQWLIHLRYLSSYPDRRLTYPL